MVLIAFVSEFLLIRTCNFRTPTCLRKSKKVSPLQRWKSSLSSPSVTELRRPLRKGDTVELKIEHVAFSGSGIAFIADGPDVAPDDVGLMVYTPKGASPGDIVRCSLTKIKRFKQTAGAASRRTQVSDLELLSGSRSYAQAIFLERTKVSPEAVEFPCIHFGNFRLGGGGCGGCTAMAMSYKRQLMEKQAQLEALFHSLPSSNAIETSPIVPCSRIWNYRNKMEFSYGRKWHVSRRSKEQPRSVHPEFALGLHAPQRFDKVVEISECHIQEKVANSILAFVRERASQLLLEPFDPVEATGYLRNIAIRTSRNETKGLEVMVNIVTSPCDVPGRLVPFANEIMDNFSEVVCVIQNIVISNNSPSIDNSKERLLAGTRSFIEQELGGLVFQISANSFFQTNTYQASKLYETVRKAAELKHEDILLDLFCGTGTIGLSMAKDCKKVIGIDLEEAAVADANRNAKRNGISNAEFRKFDLDNVKAPLKSLICPEDIDVVVVDPPRAGLHKNLLKQIILAKVRRVVYVSCNPASQIRDIRFMQEKCPGQFEISFVQPVDMFPHTHHIENVVTIDRVV